MVEANLDNRMIDAGAKLVEELDSKGMSPEAALWLYLADAHAWKLLLAESKMDKSGPKDVYRQIQKIIKDLPEDTKILRLSDIGLVRSDSPFIQLLKSTVRTGPGISGIRFTNNVVNGNLIEDAYIYRVT